MDQPTDPLFDALGFRWNRAAVLRGWPVHLVQRACFRFYRTLPEFVRRSVDPRGSSLIGRRRNPVSGLPQATQRNTT